MTQIPLERTSDIPRVGAQRHEHGAAALLLVLIAAALMSTLGLGLALLSETESLTAWNARGAEEAWHGAEAVAARVVHEAGALPSWTPLLDGTYASAFTGSMTPTTEYGETLDLFMLTALVQGQMPALASWGLNQPVWRLVAHGPLAALAGAGSARALSFVAAWVADDGAETDNNPSVDANGVISVLGQASGVGGARRSVLAVLARVCPGQAQAPVPPAMAGLAPACPAGHSPVVRVLSWREV